MKIPRDIMERTDLTATAKMVYAMIADRIGENTDCWPGIRRLAKDLGVWEGAIRRAVSELESASLIAVSRPAGNPRGQTNRYRLMDVAEIATCPKQLRSVTDTRHVAETATTRSGNRYDDVAETAAQLDQENYTHELDQEKKTQSLVQVPLSEIEKAKPRIQKSQIEAIYQAYPKHVGHGAAVKAIEKALARIAADPTRNGEPAAFLLDRVTVYATARAGQDPQFTPHPATWFNQERYLDDPEQWKETDHGKYRADQNPSRSRNEGNFRQYAELSRRAQAVADAAAAARQQAAKGH